MSRTRLARIPGSGVGLEEMRNPGTRRRFSGADRLRYTGIREWGIVRTLLEVFRKTHERTGEMEPGCESIMSVPNADSERDYR